MIATKKYNPKFLSDDELVAAFCVRQHEYQSIIETVRENSGASNQHVIVIGPRGSGKTTLLLRIAVEVQKDAALSQRFFPIVFAEESYEIRSCGEFWLECLFHLADQAKDEEADLRRIYDHLQTEQNDRTLAASCLAALLDFADRHGQRLLLMVENLNMMFNEIDDDDALGWGLRHTLQTEPRIMLLASATSRFNAIDNYDKAFYDLFREITLRPLDEAECHALWQAISGQAPSRDKIRSLQILTGGNPRLLTIVARFGANLSFQALMQGLLDLVDEHTEYFKSHLEALPPQERRIYLALADLWSPAATREIAKRARLNTNTCSTQLNRLCQRGVVVVTEKTPKRKHYYLAERMYNIYYLLRRRRRPDKVLEALITFMVAYYSKEELAHIKAKAMAELSGVSERQSVEKFVHTLDARIALTGFDTAHLKRQLQSPAAFPNDAAPDQSTTGVAEPHPTATTIDHDPVPLSSNHINSAAQLEQAATALMRKGIALLEQNRPQEALEALDDLLSRFGDSDSPPLLEPVTQALFNKGVTLWHLKRPQEALEALDDFLSRFGDSESPELLERVANALVNKGFALGQLDRPQDELAAYDDLLSRFGDSDSPELLEQVAWALFNKGVALGQLNRPQDELAVYDDLVSRFGDSDSPALLEKIAWALCNKGVALGQLKRPQDELAVYDDLVSRFGDSDSPALLSPVAKALFNKGVALGQLNRPQDELAVYDDLVSRFGDSDSPALLEQVAWALCNKGVALGQLKRPQDELAVYDDLVSRFGDSDSPALLSPVAKALFNKGVALGQLNRPQDELAVYDDLVSRFGDSDSPALLSPVAKALCNKGVALGQLKRPQDELAVYDDLVSRFGDSDSPALLEQVAWALFNKGAVLGQLERPQDELAVYDDLVSRFGDSDSPKLLEGIARALFNKGVTLGQLERPQDELAVYDELLSRFGDSDSPELLEVVALGLLNKCSTELALQHHETAIATATQLLERRSNPPLWQAEALAMRAAAYLETGNEPACVADIKACLASVHDHNVDLKDTPILNTLIDFAARFGAKPALDLIEASQAAARLAPLVVALQQELGQNPRVAIEVAEVAKDIRADIAQRRLPAR